MSNTESDVFVPNSHNVNGLLSISVTPVEDHEPVTPVEGSFPETYCGKNY